MLYKDCRIHIHIYIYIYIYIYRDCIGRMEKNMETTIMGYVGTTIRIPPEDVRRLCKRKSATLSLGFWA